MRYIVLFLISTLLSPNITLAKNRLIVIRAKKEIKLSGYTRGEKTMTVSSEVSGRVLKVNYDVGQPIGKKPFIEIDPTFIDFQIDSTLRSIKKLGITLKKTGSRVSYLEKEFLRIEALHKGDRTTEVKRDAAAQELEQARLELESTKQEKGVLETKLSELRERKNRYSIYVLEGWIITSRMVEVGEIIQPGTPLARVSNYRRLIVPLSVSGEELSAIKALPDKFDAELDGKPIKASINWINPEFDEKTRKLNIELVIRTYTGERRGGIRFTLPLLIKAGGLLVPKAAAINRYENPRVTVKETGEIIPVLVLGDSGNHLIVAEDGRLSPGTELAPAASAARIKEKD